MAWFYEDRLIGFEKKATEIRKLLLGTLLLAEDIWKDYLEQKPAGIEVLQAIKEAEEDFVNSSLADRFEKLDFFLYPGVKPV